MSGTLCAREKAKKKKMRSKKIKKRISIIDTRTGRTTTMTKIFNIHALRYPCLALTGVSTCQKHEYSGCLEEMVSGAKERG